MDRTETKMRLEQSKYTELILKKCSAQDNY